LSTTPTAGLIAHDRAVALVRLDDEQIGAAVPGVAPQPLGLEREQVAARDDDGSRPAPRSSSNTMATTVDFPLVPVTAIVRNESTKCASNSERWTNGTPCARAAIRSGTCDSTAVDATTAAQSAVTPEPSCAWIAMPSRSSAARASGRWPLSNERSLPLTRPPSITWNCASALMPLPPMPA
jgi:hypothetical protein